MVIEMFNGWYFFWLLLASGGIAALYFALRKADKKVQKSVLFGFLVLGFLLHFLKAYIPPYSVDNHQVFQVIFFLFLKL